MPEGTGSLIRPGTTAPLLSVVREALRRRSGRVALRVPVMVPHRQRVARALLQEGALAAGGVVVDGTDGDLLLIGAEAGRAERLRHLLDRLLGVGVSTAIWSLERDAEVLLNYAAAAEAAPASGPGLAGLDGWLRALPLDSILGRQVGMRLDPTGGPPRPAFLRLSVAREKLAGLMGALGDDPDLVEHARRGLAGRLLQALGDPAQQRDLMGGSLPGPLHLPLPPVPIATRSGGEGGAGAALMATVGLEAAADPQALAARRTSLAAQGWGLEIEGIGETALEILSAEALPADVLRLDWSPALLRPALDQAVRRIDPGRLILAGVLDQAALDWARALRLQRVEGVYVSEPPVSAGRPQAASALLGSVARLGGHEPARPAA